MSTRFTSSRRCRSGTAFPKAQRALALGLGLVLTMVAGTWALAAHAQSDAIPDSLDEPSRNSVSPDTSALAPTGTSSSPLALRGQGRPNPIRAIAKAAGAYGSDFVYLYTAPLRMDRSNVAAVAMVVGAGAVLYRLDEDLYRGFQRSREDPSYRAVVIDVGNFLAPLGAIASTHRWLQGAALAGWLLDVPLLRTIPVEILESNTIVASMRDPIRTLVQRNRPSDGKGARSFVDGTSFPSGHASVVCETAAILAHHARHPMARVAIWSVATITCVQRVDEPGHNHWPSDVWLGAAYGAYAGHTVAKRNEERRRGIPQGKWYDVLHRPAGDLSVLPFASPGGGGFVARARF